ncbi:MAG: DUF4832 domain-containing protein [Isosphaeraceae bacterium]|nr:DUF4832 domain-containing protein [Isosphaeraceae bacterium]
MPIAACVLASILAVGSNDDLVDRPLRSKITRVQPMTGIALWTTNPKNAVDAIQLEFAYVGYDDVVGADGSYDWSRVEKILDGVASREHQAILRFHDTYVGRETRVPASIKSRTDYRETVGTSEGKRTVFPDWSCAAWRDLVVDFYGKLAAKYDGDPRLAFLQTGFGLWSEYHIYEGPMKLGATFPSLEFQDRFLRRIDGLFKRTPWMISIDAGEASRSPIVASRELLALDFGLFDDSFNHADHASYNGKMWRALGADRWKRAPMGGEFSFYTRRDQTHALDPMGPHGRSFESEAARFHLSFIIGDSQPRHQSLERVAEAGRACGYRFRVVRFASNSHVTEVAIRNVGVAPIYRDAYPTVDGKRAVESLVGLEPGETRTYRIMSGGESPRLQITSDQILPGQVIEFEAELSETQDRTK